MVDENGIIINHQKFNRIFNNNDVTEEVAATMEQNNSCFILKYNYRKCRRKQSRNNWKKRK